ncbi:hypothetical protein JCM10213v2_003469 [Rhodosporidiobolus nylandii]
MDSPSPRSPSPAREDLDDFGAPPTLPLPAGTYTLLPFVEACDNAVLPTGPWDAPSCKRRWEEHATERRGSQGGAKVADAKGADSSVFSDEDDEDHPASPQKVDQEFLVPLFLALPPSPPIAAARRPSSASSSSRPSFSRLTPLSTPGSPTRAHKPVVPSPAPASPAAPQPIGFLRPSIVRALVEDNRKLLQMNLQPVWKFDPPISFPPPVRRPSSSYSRPGSRRGSRTAINALSNSSTDPGTPAEAAAPDGLELESVIEGLKSLAAGELGSAAGVYAVSFADWINEDGPRARSEHVERVVRGWKESGQFLECLGGWRDEEYTIWGPAPPVSEDSNPLPGSNEAFRMERSACSLFGLTTFGVHCTAYVEEDGQPLRLWVPRRSPTKQTWPSMLDNTVAGGITAGDTPRYSIIRECAEEASLPPSYVAPRIKQAGVITYHYRTAEGWLQPEGRSSPPFPPVQYIYDLRLPPPEQEGAIKPTTNPDDGEVESFELLTLEDTVESVLIDFFIRHGLLTFESDTRFIEIATRLHRPLTLPGPA